MEIPKPVRSTSNSPAGSDSDDFEAAAADVGDDDGDEEKQISPDALQHFLTQSHTESQLLFTFFCSMS